ncbi:hypothetical protein K7432_015009, partial [Basidiobolus ranarum]
MIDIFFMALKFLTFRVIDDKLAVYLKLPIREVHKICGKLKEDRLIKVMTKKESRRPE